MRIKVILPVPVTAEGDSAPIAALVRARRRAAAATTELHFVAPVAAPSALSTMGDRFVSAIALWPAAASAGEDGFDAVVVDCTCDQLSDMSGYLSVPLISALQAALGVAGWWADRWAIVTPNRGQASVYRRLVHRYGFHTHVAAVRETASSCPYGSEEEFSSLVLESRHALEDEGAELIILGCTAFTAEDSLSEVLGVPVVAPGTVAIKAAEMVLSPSLPSAGRWSSGSPPQPYWPVMGGEFNAVTVTEDGRVVIGRDRPRRGNHQNP